MNSMAIDLAHVALATALAYAGVGVVTAIFVTARGFGETAHLPPRARLLLVPGIVCAWPLLLWRTPETTATRTNRAAFWLLTLLTAAVLVAALAIRVPFPIQPPIAETVP
jgi:hypothetical protein